MNNPRMLDPPFTPFSDPFTSSLFPPVTSSPSSLHDSSLLTSPPGLTRPNFLYGSQSLLEGSTPHVSTAASLLGWNGCNGSVTEAALLSDELLSLSFLALSPSNTISSQQQQQLAQLQMVALAASSRYSSLSGQMNQMPRTSSTTSYSAINSPIGTAPGTPIGGKGRSASTISCHSSASTPNSYAHPPKNPKLYKTELCRSWMDHGRCNYGERCQYAHGEHEKRPIPRHPKYKTEACQSFHQTGYCPYGPRCHFIHSESELLAVQQLQRQTSLQQIASQAPTPPSPLSNKQHVISVSPLQHSLLSSSPNSLLSTVTSTIPSTPIRSSTVAAAYCGSAGESPGSSSTDSGSESPIGSFSPGLDIDDTPLGLLTGGGLSAYGKTMGHLLPSQPIAVRRATTGTMDEGTTKLDGLMQDIVKWTIDEDPMRKSSNEMGGPAVAPRLPVFAQLSNPPSQ